MTLESLNDVKDDPDPKAEAQKKPRARPDALLWQRFLQFRIHTPSSFPNGVSFARRSSRNAEFDRGALHQGQLQAVCQARGLTASGFIARPNHLSFSGLFMSR